MRDLTSVIVLALGIALVGAPTALSGCRSAGRSGAPALYGYRVTPATIDPVALDRAPRVLFHGGWAHYVDGTWYSRTESGWVAFVEVPAELQRQRDSIGTEQPPTNAAVPRGPTTPQLPFGGGPLPPPPPRLR